MDAADAADWIKARVKACGAAATAKAPFAHVSFEQDGARGPALDVTPWSGRATDGKPLGLAH